MKKLTILLTSMLMALTLGACSSNGGNDTPKDDGNKDTPSETGGKLVVYSPNSEGLINATIPLFEEKYNIKVELIQAGTGELIKRLQSEKDDPYADILFGGAHSQYIQNADLFENYTSKNEGLIIPDYANETGYTTSYVLDGSCLLVNTELIGDIKIEGYADLLNPELKGKIATADPASSSSAFAQLTNMLLAMGGYEDEGAWNYVKELFTNIDGKISSGSSAVYKSVADGEMVVALTYEDPAATLVRDGAPVKIVYPVEGSVYLPATTGIIKNAKNMENAQLFVDFITSKEVQDIYGTTLTNRPVLKEVEVADFMTPMDEIVRIEEDREYVNSHKDEIVEKYKDIYTSVAK
ncbi:ABC transporter substrate-binding protein [Dielma fastidiosa]|uniref:Iron(III) transport system substrate-binding protein n=1 Tax=Dielma fastidiosa TaxID=1034346 RepID=A0A318KUP9_9FIRM|nr:ABC transporter substrate-binding protein [Dielma fastidiosa]PXX80578.1 iron(III) transport system substrate-binding protein [Dielma fastidiosa]